MMSSLSASYNEYCVDICTGAGDDGHRLTIQEPIQADHVGRHTHVLHGQNNPQHIPQNHVVRHVLHGQNIPQPIPANHVGRHTHVLHGQNIPHYIPQNHFVRHVQQGHMQPIPKTSFSQPVQLTQNDIDNIHLKIARLGLAIKYLAREGAQ